MANRDVALKQFAFGHTVRRDAWWIQPLAVLAVLGGFIIYATWAAFSGTHYRFGPYLSPFYSPELFGDPQLSWFGAKPGWWPGWLAWSPALLILWAPAGFRLTCYYYRGAYYKAFWADPPACTVGEPRNSYWGENSLPLMLQNIHRYFLYLALIFLVFLLHDVWNALWFEDPATHQVRFGVGVGTLVLAINVILLGGYTFSCHSLRHVIGGRFDCVSQSPLRQQLYNCATCMNRRHPIWAWFSLVWVAFSDVYVRLCSMGVWSDRRVI